jgi:zinc transport system substrate-binding protein
MLRKAARPIAALVVGVTASVTVGMAAGCGAAPPGGNPGRVDVVAAFYPLEFLAERIGGDRVSVTNLVAPGAEPHDVELQPSQVARVANASLVLYLRGFQPAVDAAVDQQAGDRALDLASAGDRKDPHIWLDPILFAEVASQVAARLAVVDPDHAGEYAARAADLHTALDALDSEFATGLATCARREIVTAHDAFGYLSARYRLEQIPVTGLSPDEEATPRSLADAVDEARARGATTVFFEPLVSPKLARTLAAEVGARAEALDPLEGIRPGSADDYLSVMRRNLATLRTALGCS